MEIKQEDETDLKEYGHGCHGCTLFCIMKTRRKTSTFCWNCPDSRLKNFRELFSRSAIPLITRQIEVNCLFSITARAEIGKSESAESIFGVLVLLRIVRDVQNSAVE